MFADTNNIQKTMSGNTVFSIFFTFAKVNTNHLACQPHHSAMVLRPFFNPPLQTCQSSKNIQNIKTNFSIVLFPN